jgi:photosystem II stability/assembly factor-like uncharacterized protein
MRVVFALLLTVCALMAPGVEGPQPFSLSALAWRNVGPLRGGRSIAAVGSASRRNEYYFGATGGGLWKTTDGGNSWRPVTDGQVRSSSVGAIAVSPSNPDVVYIGMGEVQLRGNAMEGDGVYASADAGATWRQVGLSDTQVIARLRVHPTNPLVVYAAALGDPTQPSQARGVYRTRDGGANWKKVLFRDDRTGAADLVLDPHDPDTLYAALWQVYRIPWQLWSGGPGSGLFKSTDGGDTWTEITRAPGLPGGVVGKIGIAVSGADSQRLYAVVEARAGGLYRSDDAGASWVLANGNRDLWQRSFYFNRVVADPRERDTVYVLNFMLARSADGGATYQFIQGRHVDYHDLWIDPQDPQRMVVSDDGGATVSVNGGTTWSNQRYPTAQMYRVETTADFPYHVVGSQQDNTSVAVRGDGPGETAGEPGSFFYPVGGGESGWVAPHPTKPDLFFAGATNTLTRFDRRTGRERDVQPWPRIVMGEPARDMPERWNWTYPIIFSTLPPHDLYVASQHVWRSRDEGLTWERISGDLTRADPDTLGVTGGPITPDQDGPEVYGTVFALAPSRLERNTLWAGSDDGLVHVTRDGGGSWVVVTPKVIPVNTRISVIETSPHAPGRAFVAARRNQLGDRQPFLFRTDDFGATWARIDAGLPRTEVTHVIREDSVRPDLLYVGTDHGVRVSFDGGTNWQSLQLELPDVQVPDLKVEKHDLVIATHGRSFYVLDDIAPLRQWEPSLSEAGWHLFRPEEVTRSGRGATIDFILAAPAQHLALEILDRSGAVIRELPPRAKPNAGHHRLGWDLRTRGATTFPGMVIEAPSPARGVMVPPGEYRVRLTVDGSSQTQPFTVTPDPRLAEVTNTDYAAQYRFAVQLRDATSGANQAVIRIRALKAQLRGVPATMRPLAEAIEARLTEIEGDLYQIRNQSPKDKIANPIRLNDRLAGLLALVQVGEGAPTAAHMAVAAELLGELRRHLDRLDAVIVREIGALNGKLAAVGAPPVVVR